MCKEELTTDIQRPEEKMKDPMEEAISFTPTKLRHFTLNNIVIITTDIHLYEETLMFDNKLKLINYFLACQMK